MGLLASPTINLVGDGAEPIPVHYQRPVWDIDGTKYYGDLNQEPEDICACMDYRARKLEQTLQSSSYNLKTWELQQIFAEVIELSEANPPDKAKTLRSSLIHKSNNAFFKWYLTYKRYATLTPQCHICV
jgi:hypothetical protein